MEIYLVQHGEAKPEQEDPARPLTNQGRKEVERIARWLSRTGLKITEIRHSPKLRAKQTAEIFAKELGTARISEMQGVAPNDDPKAAADWLNSIAEPVMLVGHLPHLGRLASLLLTGSPDADMIEFRMGGAVCLSKEDGKWRVRWILRPEIV